MQRHAVAPEPLRHFGDARSRSVWQWQLLLAGAIVAVAAITALLAPEKFGKLPYILGLLGIVTITLFALTVPWHKATANQILLVPLADIVAIGALDLGLVAPLSYLWVFPVGWIATYYGVGTTVGAVSLTGALMLLELFVGTFSVPEIINMLIQLIAILFIAVTMSVGATRNRSAKALLRAQSGRLGNALDRVTDQQARNKRLLDSLEIGVARIGSEGVLEVTNKAFARLLALDESSSSRHAMATEYRERRGEPVPWTETTINRAARGELFVDEVVWVFGIDGEWHALNVSSKIIESSDAEGHRDDGRVLVVREITATVDPHASHSVAMRAISHELRNPLTAILGHVDLLLDRDDITEPTRAQLEVVGRASERMNTLIDNALSVDGPQHDDTDVCYDLAEIVAASIEAFTPEALARSIALEPELDEELPLTGDAFRMRQVVDNLISNAIKYSHRGGRVTVRSQPPTDGDVVLEVIDTGIGISAEDLERIFEPDFRAASALESGVKGTGLGLSISRDILTENGGRILVSSKLGNGTTVSIRLPHSLEGHRA